jgi:hypothetical protein
MQSLPIEICYDFSRYLNHRDYNLLRQTCKFLSCLDSIQYLYFQSYKESAHLNDPELLSQIRLDNQCLDDDSFIYIAVNGHSYEFIRLFHTTAIVKISPKAKNDAFAAIIKNRNSHEMIFDLLKDGFINAKISFDFKYRGESKYQATVLHWACLYDYMDVVLLLLKYDNVDFCSKDHCGDEPIHHAAELGHTQSHPF